MPVPPERDESDELPRLKACPAVAERTPAADVDDLGVRACKVFFDVESPELLLSRRSDTLERDLERRRDEHRIRSSGLLVELAAGTTIGLSSTEGLRR
jgi:hypothetical protein